MWDHGEKFVSLNPELRKLDGSFRLQVDRKLLSKTPFTLHQSKSCLNPCLVIYYDQLLSSMMAGLRDKVKGGEGWSQPFTSHNPSVYRGFRRKGEG